MKVAGSNPRRLNMALISRVEYLRSLGLRLSTCPASGAGASAGGKLTTFSIGGMIYFTQ